jgi:hypothetical protein
VVQSSLSAQGAGVGRASRANSAFSVRRSRCRCCQSPSQNQTPAGLAGQHRHDAERRCRDGSNDFAQHQRLQRDRDEQLRTQRNNGSMGRTLFRGRPWSCAGARRDAGDADGMTAGTVRKSRRDFLFRSESYRVSGLPPLGTNATIFRGFLRHCTMQLRFGSATSFDN